MKEIIIDIETIPQEISESKMKIVDRKIEKKRGDNKDINKFCALSPELGRIVCIGIDIISGDQKNAYQLLAPTTEKEPEMLSCFWDVFRENKDFRIVTFNGKAFDIPYLYKRSIIRGVPASAFLNFRKYEMYKHFDCLEVLSNFSTYGNMFTLDEYCEFYNIQHEDNSSGKDVYEQYKKGDFASITKHCAEDVQKTKELYQKIKKYYILS